MGEYRHKSEAANLEARACKEILLTRTRGKPRPLGRGRIAPTAKLS
jgi:hypothetical protein